ncbi:cysteine desulfurase [Candidatus Woesearchaeota archaeon]|jgi:cysteine desulfurase / selenocysteine lyase|nr:cysteine desulfurase [Candidatus Woesearchaeota archaeon]MBT4368327.1 cysteine desulfurase [Candidatus Woesearchaeota archaeon]MBT4712816.1 cysteine desulfurase [Candidatus Woesearchaeota archaeon]MBT6639728.1 cysteine desulfurase [Candidatus Woesearchaeota archaeon]MBT7133900.1 cysteine desulfurase [Candidatus Woesearchaeota archaeon]
MREQFKVLQKNIIYVDSACMSLRPDCVINKIKEYYEEYPVCAGRSNHKLANTLVTEVLRARKLIQKLLNAKSEKEIIFTKNTTEGLNLVANSFKLEEGDAVLITEKEHNSNLVPWLKLKEKGIQLIIQKLNDDGTFNLAEYKTTLENNPNIKLVSFHHASNIDGVIIPAKEIIQIAHKSGIKVLLDAAQSLPHITVDVKKLDVDFLAFSGHKMMGPSGIGVLYGKTEELNKLDPFLVGGETVTDTTHDSVSYEQVPEKFEAGLQNYAGIVGLGEAAKFLMKTNPDKIHKHEVSLNKILTERLKDRVTLIGPEDPELRGGIFNFYIENIDMHNFSSILDSKANIATRSGQHCVHSYYNAKNLPVSTRISLYIYNTEEEVNKIVDEVEKVIELLS